MTPEELQALADKAVADVAKPESQTFRDRSVNNGSIGDRIKKVEFLEGRTAAASGRRPRVIRAYPVSGY